MYLCWWRQLWGSFGQHGTSGDGSQQRQGCEAAIVQGQGQAVISVLLPAPLAAGAAPSQNHRPARNRHLPPAGTPLRCSARWTTAASTLCTPTTPHLRQRCVPTLMGRQSGSWLAVLRRCSACGLNIVLCPTRPPVLPPSLNRCCPTNSPPNQPSRTRSGCLPRATTAANLLRQCSTATSPPRRCVCGSQTSRGG